MKNYFYLFPCIRFWSTYKKLFVFLFLHLVLHSLTELGDFIHSLRESSHYTYLLAIVINNLSDIQILHLTYYAKQPENLIKLSFFIRFPNWTRNYT